MEYADYVKLGFIRTDVNDSVELSKTGYGGFYLERRITKRITLCADWQSLDTPKMQISEDGVNYETVTVNDRIVRILCCETSD